MPVQLMKLRGVPDDELAELYELLESEHIEFYETSAGNWGISLPALWLKDESQLEHAKSVLDHYHRQRFSSAREEYEKQKNEGRARGWLDLIRENPFQFILYMLIVLAMVYFSTVPFFSFGETNV